MNSDNAPEDSDYGTMTARPQTKDAAQPSSRFVPVLVCLQGSQRGMSFPLKSLETILGRGDSANIIVNDELASRLHARILYKNWNDATISPECYVEDMRSRNGTELNGEPLAEMRRLRQRDRIQIGSSVFYFSVKDEAELALERSLFEHATKDPLTGLANRRQFQGQLFRYLEQAGQTDQHVALLIADVDHFKKINDNYGHDVGDKALAHVATIIKESCRTRELCGRWGGEEFVILLPDTEADGVLAAGERIRQALESAPLVTPGHTIAMTASFGGACLAPHGSADDLFKRADQQLYKAKQSGRNRVCIDGLE